MDKILLNLKTQLIKVINFNELGFTLFQNNDTDFQYEYHRSTIEKTDTLQFGFGMNLYRDYSFLSSIRYTITFPIISKILLDVGKHKVIFQNFDLNDYTVFAISGIGLQESTNYHYRQQKLTFIKDKQFNEAIFEESLSIFQEQLTTNVLPFFDKIKTLQDVNDEILEKVDWNTYPKYISGEAGAKALIIMKLCNNPRYEAYKQRSDKLIAEQLKDPQYALYKGVLHNQQIIMDEVFDYLESGKYLEIDDTSDIEIVQPKVVEVKKTKRKLPRLPINTEVEAVFSECQGAFKALGIYFDKKFTLNDYRNDATWQSWEMETPDKINWVYFLLLFSGTNVYNHNIDEYQPVSPNVYYFDSEWDGFVSYKEIMERLNLLSGKKLPFSNIEDKEEGSCTFEYEGESHEWTFELNNDWTDPEIFERFVSLVSADIEKTYYIMLEGQGGIIVYYNKDERQRFETFFNVKLVRL